MSGLTGKQAIAEVRKFSQFIRAFEHLAEVADTLADAEQLVLEAGHRKQQIDAQVDGRTEALGVLEERITAAHTSLAETTDQAKARAIEIISEANAEATKIRKPAELARARAEKEFDELRLKLKDAQGELDTIESEHTRVTNRLNSLREELQAFVGDTG